MILSPVAVSTPVQVRVAHCIFSYTSTGDTTSTGISVFSTKTRASRILYFTNMAGFREMLCPLSFKMRMSKVLTQIHSLGRDPVMGFVGASVAEVWIYKLSFKEKITVWRVNSNTDIVDIESPHDCAAKEAIGFITLSWYWAATFNSRTPGFVNYLSLSHNTLMHRPTYIDLQFFYWRTLTLRLGLQFKL